MLGAEFSDRALRLPRKSVEESELDAPDNNGLSRGQNFMKVEKWLRDASLQQPIIVKPGVIKNIEDGATARPAVADEPPTERDRVPPVPGQLATSQSHLQSKRR